MSEFDHAERLQEANRYLVGDVDTEHARAELEFLLLTPAQRIEVLKNWDRALEEQTGVTRAHAELLTKKRNLEDLHWTLTRAGR